MFIFVIRKEIMNFKIRKINLVFNKSYILEKREVISDSNEGKNFGVGGECIVFFLFMF